MRSKVGFSNFDGIACIRVLGWHAGDFLARIGVRRVARRGSLPGFGCRELVANALVSLSFRSQHVQISPERKDRQSSTITL